MDAFWNACDALSALPRRGVVGSFVIALACSAAAACAFALGRRKVADKSMLDLGVTLAACLASMALSVALVAEVRRRADGASPRAGAPARSPVPLFRPAGPPPPGPSPFSSAGQQIVEAADADGDGHLTPDELGRLVRGAFPAGKGRVNASDLNILLSGRAGHFPPAPPPAPPATPGR